jgi:hypothetical protein
MRATAACLLCAALFVSAAPVHGQEPSPLGAEEARIWKQHGFNAVDAAEWNHVGFSPSEARQWVEAGIPFAQWADQWRGEGFGPAEASEWVEKVYVSTAAEFREFGFGIREALDWIDNGIPSALRAKEFRDGGFTAAEAGLWWDRGEYPDEAKVWRDAGFGLEEALEWKYGPRGTLYGRDGRMGYSRVVHSVEWAREWRAAGFSAAESKQCLRFRMDLDEAVQWSEAGFGIQEAFQWKDSGFGPEEAEQKSAAGLTPSEAEEARAALEQPGDEIVSFHSEIELHPDSTLTVTETIEVEDRPGGVVQGCLKRTFPAEVTLRHDEDSIRTAWPSYRLLAVLGNGAAAGYSTSKSPWADRTICIRGKDEPLEEGANVFTIRYETDYRLLDLYNHDELFFDVTGRSLEMRVKEASATVTLPKGAHLIFADGYAGPPERKYFSTRVEEADGHDRIHYAVTRSLNPDMAFQVSIAFTKGAARPDRILRASYLDRRLGHIFSAIAVFAVGLLLVVVYFITVWLRVGKDPEREPAAPQFEPPEGISPAMVRFIVTGGRLDEGVVSATLVKLAQIGVIKIAKEGDRYRISRTGEPPTHCFPEEKAFLENILQRSDSFVVDAKRARKTLRSVVSPLKKILQRQYERYIVTNSHYLWRMLALSAVAAVGGLIVLDLPIDDGEPGPLIVYGVFAFVVVGIMLAVFYRLLKAPTRAGSQIMDRIEGFRKFLAVNYEEARPFGKRPETDAPPFLEKHLPYAIALGIDSEYVSMRAKTFEWYGGRPGSFSAYDFTSSLKMKKPGVGRSSHLTRPRSVGAGL